MTASGEPAVLGGLPRDAPGTASAPSPPVARRRTARCNCRFADTLTEACAAGERSAWRRCTARAKRCCGCELSPSCMLANCSCTQYALLIHRRRKAAAQGARNAARREGATLPHCLEALPRLCTRRFARPRCAVASLALPAARRPRAGTRTRGLGHMSVLLPSHAGVARRAAPRVAADRVGCVVRGRAPRWR